MAQNSELKARRQGGPGRPFRKGESGNPGGRPKSKILSAELRKALEANDGVLARWLIAALVKMVLDGKSDAMKMIFDRTEGKIPQPIIGDEEQPLTFKFVDPRGNSDSRAKPRP